MSVTILETLQNADYNMQNCGRTGALCAKVQLHNAVTLLEKEYSLTDEIESLLEEFGRVENVPDKEAGGIRNENSNLQDGTLSRRLNLDLGWPCYCCEYNNDEKPCVECEDNLLSFNANESAFSPIITPKYAS